MHTPVKKTPGDSNCQAACLKPEGGYSMLQCSYVALLASTGVPYAIPWHHYLRDIEKSWIMRRSGMSMYLGIVSIWPARHILTRSDAATLPPKSNTFVDTNLCFPPYKHQQNTMWCCLMPSCFTSAVPMATKKSPLSPCPSPSSCHHFRWFSMPDLQGTEGEWVLGHTHTHLNSSMSLAQKFFISTNQTICVLSLPYFFGHNLFTRPWRGKLAWPHQFLQKRWPQPPAGSLKKIFGSRKVMIHQDQPMGDLLTPVAHRRFVHHIAGYCCGAPYM